MTQLIAICDATARIRSDCFSVRLVNHLETHFGSEKGLERCQIFRIKNQRTQAAHMFSSSIVVPSVGDLFGTQVGLVKNGRLSADNFAALINGPILFDWSCALKVNDSYPDGFHEFLDFSADIEDAFWEEAGLLPLSDIVLVLDDNVSQESDLIEFTRAAVERFKDSNISVVIYSDNHLAQAVDIYCQFENFVSPSNSGGMSFLGYLPKDKKDGNYDTLETIGLQNIALSLLKLNYLPILNNMLGEKFKGSLH